MKLGPFATRGGPAAGFAEPGCLKPHSWKPGSSWGQTRSQPVSGCRETLEQSPPWPQLCICFPRGV